MSQLEQHTEIIKFINNFYDNIYTNYEIHSLIIWNELYFIKHVIPLCSNNQIKFQLPTDIFSLTFWESYKTLEQFENYKLMHIPIIIDWFCNNYELFKIIKKISNNIFFSIDEHKILLNINIVFVYNTNIYLLNKILIKIYYIWKVDYEYFITINNDNLKIIHKSDFIKSNNNISNNNILNINILSKIDKDCLLNNKSPLFCQGNEDNYNYFFELYNYLDEYYNNISKIDTTKEKLKKQDTKKARVLITLLNDNRIFNHNDWVYIGELLYNIDENLLEDWIIFSQRYSDKYKKDDCEEYWNNMHSKRISFRYLIQMVKEDNPKKFNKFIAKEYKNCLVNYLVTSPEHEIYYITKSLYNKYGDRFICALPKKNIWYELVNNRWCLSDNGTSLMRLISEDFSNDFLRLAAELNLKAINLNSSEKEDAKNKACKTQKICDKLLNITFKKQIMEHAKDIFYEDKFYEIIIKENLKKQDIEKARLLITLLNDKRVSNHNDWLYVGHFLHNLDENLLEDWQIFSQQYPDKKEKCKEYWLDMTSKNVSFRYLIQMTKEDNYEEYKKFINSELKFLDIYNTYYIAKALYNKYCNIFVCISNKKNIWYEFVNNQWCFSDNGTSLMRLISEDFSNDFLKLATELNIKAIKLNEFDKEHTRYKAKRIHQIYEKLLDITFKKQIMEHAKNIFYEEDFYEINISKKN